MFQESKGNPLKTNQMLNVLQCLFLVLGLCTNTSLCWEWKKKL